MNEFTKYRAPAALTIRWTGTENDLNCAVWLTGPALAVFEGEMETDGR